MTFVFDTEDYLIYKEKEEIADQSSVELQEVLIISFLRDRL